MQKEKLSYSETARQFDVSNHHRIQDWERIYLTEGPEGFAIERRGRKSKGRPKKLSNKVEEDLLAEVQRLRAENAYLKKLSTPDKYETEKTEMVAIYHKNKEGNYGGYRRITIELRSCEIYLNNKAVQGLINDLDLVCRARMKKISLLQGESGKN